MDVVALRTAIAARLDDVVGPHGQTSPYWLSNPLVPSMQVVGTPDVEFAEVARPHDDSEIELLVQAFVGIVDEVAAQDRLDRWKASSGPESVRENLERRDSQGRFLDGLAYDVTVLRASENLLFDLPSIPGASVLGCEFTVRVSTSG